MFNIVLFSPEIPQNTGNIVRTCSVTGSVLHLIRPLGFSISDRSLKRAGLDYWDEADVRVYDDFSDFLEKNPDARIFLITTKSDRYYNVFEFRDGDYFVFGRETSGLPDEIHEMFPERRLRIPMLDKKHARCLNLSNSVCVILYEALRQQNFKNLK